MRAGVVGAGYVGLATAVGLARRGRHTVCVDTDAAKVDGLRTGACALDEPGLTELLAAGIAAGTLEFSTDYGALAGCDAVFVCVPTPSGADGGADLGAVHACLAELKRVLTAGAIVVIKSTVPVGTTGAAADFLSASAIHAVSNPEFLREGHAVADAMHPDRIVIGTPDREVAARVGALYGTDGSEPSTKVLWMSRESAELAKYASNAFLAVKLSYTNALAQLCAEVGADIRDVTGCMGADERIGAHFLQPGPGWGGSCLPKDTAALLHTGRQHGLELSEVAAARATNAAQTDRILTTLSRHTGRPLASMRVTALGLTFKAGTGDVRASPALAICGALTAAGTEVTGHDPRLDVIDTAVLRRCAITAVNDPYLATKGSDAIVVLTEWPEFRDLDWARIAEHAPGAVVIDTRNLLDRTGLAGTGLTYLGNGTPSGF
ncbi:UDP-glucose 6-dehydrogenase [Mycolicibacterium canariasense]|uniref:UDP-glucose 6-dehydrogenase n=1 Tax=Mycolicibacterium canariasense TaxID=228230 RepID=A0A100WI96_MYCCR|nr:UDP-glucose/GDP-mannose dehydrogenase family protein [Mycolicibacterium canariasense]MCV7208227.1 UDP-glucose/GDP-mannose dehydrogenase family protein [Mycolicibacterium canariasense]ORV09441.1 UDP-glucose 6-dehydrogenase [Mycolicibacterium canariasense]GAS99029.1 UDP-glucose 6-dehydrogenase [Mycolicibacterium canariasense]